MSRHFTRLAGQEGRDDLRYALRRDGRRSPRRASHRGNTVGFALTVLQRRLASSPQASLKAWNAAGSGRSAAGAHSKAAGGVGTGAVQPQPVAGAAQAPARACAGPAAAKLRKLSPRLRPGDRAARTAPD